MSYARSLRGRLTLLFFLLFVTISLLGLASFWSLSHSNEVAVDVQNRWLPNVRLLGDLNNFTSDYRTAEANSLLAANNTEVETSLLEIRQLGVAVIRAERDYERIPHGQEETELYRSFSRTWSAYQAIADQVTLLSSVGRAAEAAALYRGRSRITYDAASEMLGRLTGTNVELAAQASARSAAAYAEAVWLMGFAMATAGLTLTVVLVQVRRQISFPLLDLGRVMHRLAANDTGVEIDHRNRQDEIGEMARAVVVFRANAIELMHSQVGLAQQATMLEEKLAAEQALTQMQRNFVSMITHEFRTPLTQIDAQAQRMANLGERLSPEDLDDRVARIRVAVARIVRMIDQLVATTRLMDGDAQLFFHPEPVDLSKLLHDVCRSYREISPGTQIVEDFCTPSMALTGDAKLLFQAFSNLVANAIKYSLPPAKVVIRGRANGPMISVAIEDSGIGIPVRDQEHIFSRYYRGSNVSDFVGTGVGLFLVATVLRLHGGNATVESVEGKGSRFTVTLPNQV